MKRSDIIPMPEYHERYINLTEDLELIDVLVKSLNDLEALDLSFLNEIGDKAYAPGKWTVKEVLQHLIDCERIFNYRTLLFARNDKTPVPGFDQDYYVKTSNAGTRTVNSLVDELKSVRRSTISLFGSFNDTQLKRKGISWKYEMSVLAMGFTIAGHQIHHFNILRERYF
jgi:hypothetical protein